LLYKIKIEIRYLLECNHEWLKAEDTLVIEEQSIKTKPQTLNSAMRRYNRRLGGGL